MKSDPKKMKICRSRGSVLVATLLVIIPLMIFLTTFFFSAVSNFLQMERERKIYQAFHLAEAGVERALYDLRQDLMNSAPSFGWTDADINGMMTAGPDKNQYYALPYADTTLGEGSYQVQVKNGPTNRTMWVRATGYVGPARQTIEVFIKGLRISIWDNALFADSREPDSVIRGNADIHGSVHLLGNNLLENELAVDMDGTSGLARNNYEGLAAELRNRVPDLEEVTFGGETVETLNAELRVKNGLVGLSGTALVGQPHEAGNLVKETADAVFVSDGFAGNKGSVNVYSDNGWSQGYDMGDALQFPRLTAPYKEYDTYLDYLKARALILGNEISTIQPDSVFSYQNENGSIAMDGAGNLEISGIIYIDGENPLWIKKAGEQKVITYQGVGSILVTGEVKIDASLVTDGPDSFPGSIIGVMTPRDVTFNTAQIDVMGLFYAEQTVQLQKQTTLVGTAVSNYFNMGPNVPSIYQVPSTVDNLPPGLIGSDPIWAVKIIAWQNK